MCILIIYKIGQCVISWQNVANLEFCETEVMRKIPHGDFEKLVKSVLGSVVKVKASHYWIVSRKDDRFRGDMCYHIDSMFYHIFTYILSYIYM
jgi:hypothetical protein